MTCRKVGASASYYPTSGSCPTRFTPSPFASKDARARTATASDFRNVPNASMGDEINSKNVMGSNPLNTASVVLSPSICAFILYHFYNSMG